MNKLFKNIFIFIIFIICIVPNGIYANNKYEKIYKVGFYEYKPYYFINEDNKADGYYHEVLELLAKNLNIKFEYIEYEFSDSIESLKNGELDLLLGIHRTEERERELIYTDHYIGVETYGIYTNKDILYGDLSKLENAEFAFIQDEVNSDWMIDFFHKKEINVVPTMAKSYEEAVNLLNSNRVDVTIAAIENEDLKDQKKIYEYSAGPVYIVSGKGNESIINEFNNLLEKYAELEKTPIQFIQEKYFGKSPQIDNKGNEFIAAMILLVFIMLLFVMSVYLYPRFNQNKIKVSIKERMNNDEYRLFYQPIVNPKHNDIVGFEALLRLNDKKLGIISPSLFLNEIEENDMLFDISIWILKKVIYDYHAIKELNNLTNDNFYISINVSLKEIENEEFIKRVINLLLDSNIGKNKICLEIVEKVGINNLSKIKKSIKSLKESGFMIAIDDFGVEYSNLDILEKFDFDTIKIDKYFIDNMENSEMRMLIMNFLSRLTNILGKSIVAEGVERVEQIEIIKHIENDKFYIQGYIYSKPVSIEDIKDIKIIKI